MSSSENTPEKNGVQNSLNPDVKIIQPAKVSKENLKEKVVADPVSEKSSVKAILQETKNGKSNLCSFLASFHTKLVISFSSSPLHKI